MARKRKMSATQRERRRDRRRKRLGLLRAATRHGEQIDVTPGRAS